MTQYAVVRSTGEIVALVARDIQPANEPGIEYHEVLPPVPGFPDAPFSGAVWTWGNSGPYWHDPRSTIQRAEDVRAKRDALLLATDWVVTRAFETGTAVPTAWSTYRAALRSLPEQSGFPDTVIWPAEPAP